MNENNAVAAFDSACEAYFQSHSLGSIYNMDKRNTLAHDMQMSMSMSRREDC